MNLEKELISAAGVSLAFGAIFASAEFWRRRFAPPVEWTRKAVHVGGGLVACAFPWLFESSWTVLGLCIGFGALLLLARAFGWLPSVQGVQRKSVGELLFPVSVMLLFALAHESPVFYVIPMLILVVSDALAALVGKSYGRTRFSVDEGELKSIEGSLVFFGSAFLAVLLPLLAMSSIDPWIAVLVALQMAFLVTCFEAISLSGIDNLVLPLAGWYIAVQITQGSLSWTLIQMLGQALAVLFAALIAWRYRFLAFSAVVTAQLYAYGAFAFGGPYWLATPMLATFAFIWLQARAPQPDPPPERRFQVSAVFYVCLVPLALYVLNNFILIFSTRLNSLGLAGPLFAVFCGVHAALLAGIFCNGRDESLLRMALAKRLAVAALAACFCWVLVALPAFALARVFEPAAFARSAVAALLGALAYASLLPRLGDALARLRGLAAAAGFASAAALGLAWAGWL